MSALDLKLRKTMRIELKRLQRETGVTFIFVTHDQEEALAMSDRVAVLCDGKVRQTGAPDDIYEHPADRFVADFIGEANLFSGRVTEAGTDGIRVLLDGGASLVIDLEHGAAASAVTGEVMLAIRPERVVLTAEAGGAALPGRIAEAVYQGNTICYEVLLADGKHITALELSTHGKARFAAGDNVGVVLDGQFLRILPQ